MEENEKTIECILKMRFYYLTKKREKMKKRNKQENLANDGKYCNKTVEINN